MKKLLWIVALGLLLAGCSVAEHTTSDGTSYTMITAKWEDDFNKCNMDMTWYEQADTNMPPVSAISDCYVQRQTYQLCNDWDYIYQTFYYRKEFVMLMRSGISEALIRKNENPLKCRNPNNDTMVKAKIELDIANQRARNAEAIANENARNAEAAAQKARNAKKKLKNVLN